MEDNPEWSAGDAMLGSGGRRRRQNTVLKLTKALPALGVSAMMHGYMAFDEEG